MTIVAHSRMAVALSVALLASLASGAEADDGIRLINQELALAGDVTPDDEPGFPVTISRAGSYRLSGNLRVNVPYVNVIEIMAVNVTLDLNGFTIQGPRDQCSRRIVPTWCTSGANLWGSAVLTVWEVGSNLPGPSNITIFNGTVRAMPENGVYLSGPHTRVDRLTVTENGKDGIVVGAGAIVSNNIVTHNNGKGIARAQISLNEGTASAVGNVVQWNGKEGLYFLVMRNNVLWANNPGGPQVSVVIDAGGNVCDITSC